MKRLITGMVLLFSIFTITISFAANITPVSWYQINNVYAGGGIDWMPTSLEVLREGNWIKGSFWNFDLTGCGELISANIEYEFIQHSDDAVEARLVFFEGTTNWPADPTPSFYEYDVCFVEYNSEPSHQYQIVGFQFAVYYTALEKGFCNQDGLEVKILKGEPNLFPIDEVVQGGS
jgi:hypothetical protein